MSFYNPYMKTPDWGQGIGDIGQLLMMMKLMSQMGGPKETTERTPGVTEPPTGRHGMSMMAGAQPQPGAMPQTGGPPQAGPTGAPMQMNPQIMMLLQMLMQQGQQPQIPQFRG